jgi:hypothetical protein
VYFSKAFSDAPPDVADYKSGVCAMIATYLGYCALQGPSSLMVRPHPVVWRLVHGCAMVYLMALAFLLMQGKTEARVWLKVRPIAPYQLPAYLWSGGILASRSLPAYLWSGGILASRSLAELGCRRQLSTGPSGSTDLATSALDVV